MPLPDESKSSSTLTDTLSWVLSISSTSAQGLMSLGGTLAIWPTSIIWGLCAFGLTVAYEGEVNAQNSKGAIDKLIDPNYAKTQVMQQYLREKFAKFDEDRARFTLSDSLTDDEKKKVCLLHEVVILKQKEGYRIGYCNKSGAYEENKIEKPPEFLDSFEKDQFFENDSHIEELNKLLDELYPISKINQTQKDYPLYAKQYIAQLIHVYQLELQLHEQRPDETDKEALAAMRFHLEAFEKLISESLFNNENSNKDTIKPTSEINVSIPVTNYKNVKDEYKFSYTDFSLKATKINQFVPGRSKPPKHGKPIDIEILNEAIILDPIKEGLYNYYKGELLTKWIEQDREVWLSKLAWHEFYLNVAVLFSICSGIIVAWGNTYLYLEMFAIIPYLALLPASVLPFIIVPLAILSGIAQFTIMFNSLAEMIAENPFQKFWDRIKAAHWTTTTQCFLGAFIALFSLATLVSFCSAGTWVTVFGQTLPLFGWMSIMPNIALNYILPLFIGLSDLPFSFQSIAGTLENLENNPIVIFLSRFFGALYNGRITLPNNWGEWSAILYSLGVAALGLTPDEFEKETLWQKINPFRIIIRLFYEPLRILLFSIHLFCEGEMFDRIEGVPIFLSVLSAMVLNLAQDLDYFFGHSHIDSTDTSAILKNHLADANNHDHRNNLPELILRFPFKPIFWLAYLWSSWGVPEEDTASKDAHWDKIEGFKPRNKQALNQVANYRKTDDHQLFLFKAAQDKYPTSLNLDPCCVPNTFL